MKPEDALASLSGNWNIPQDASITPRSGVLSRAQDYIYGSEAGRRMMSVVDMWNSLTGGLQGVLGNVSPGVETAVTPALEMLVNKGTISRATNLFDQNSGYFIDRMGDVYSIGDLLSPRSLDHPDVLAQAGKNLKDLYGPYGMPNALNDLDLIRVRNLGHSTNIQMTRFPSNAEMEQIMALVERNPKAGISLDLHDLSGKQPAIGKYFSNPSEAIDAIHSFYGR